MAYIGKEPAVGNFQVCDAISVVNGQAAYTLQVSSTNVVPESANHMLVSLNGILQKPNSSFTVSGSTLTFASNLATGDVIDFVMLLGNVLDIGVPSDSTVTNAKTNFTTTSSAAGLQIKGDGTTAGALQLNCEQNSHGIQLQSPPHSANQSYTLKFPSGNVTAGKFLKVDSVSGSGTTGVGTMTFADASAGFTLGTPVSTNSGSEIDFTGIPSTATFIILNMQFVSLSGSDHIRIQLGTSSGVATSGYDTGLGEIGSSSTQGISNGLPMYLASAGRQVSSTVFITLSNSSNNTYNMSSVNYRRDSAQMQISQGSITLSGVLDRVRIETTGSNTFDGGTANIMYI
jgi:hypothetical protein